MCIKIIFVLIFMKMCSSHEHVSGQGFVSENPNLMSRSKEILEQNLTISSQKNAPAFRIQLPFMDMEIQTDRNLFVIQEKVRKEKTLILHGGELYQLFVDRSEKRLFLIGHLGGAVKDMELLGAEVIMWREFHILVVAMDEYLEIYEIPSSIFELREAITKNSKRRNETAPTFESIQQISLPGKYKQHFLIDPIEDHIMLIVGINFTKLYGRLHSFSWSNSYFQPLEELTVSPLHVMRIVGGQPKYLIRGRIINHQSKTIITVHKIQSPAMTLQTVQTFTANSRVIHAISFRNQNYLIACANQQKQCNSFRMNSNGVFSVHLQRSSKDLVFDKFVGAKNFIVAAHRNQVSVYTDGRLDCYASFITNETDITSIQTIVNGHGENFILLNYKRPFHTLVRFVDVQFEPGNLLGSSGMNETVYEDSSTLFRHRHIFEDIIGRLRSLLLQRINAMNTFRRISSDRTTKPLEVQHSVRVNSGNINIIKVIGSNLLSPLQMLQRVNRMRENYGLRRIKREIFQNYTLNRSSTNPPLRVKHLKIKNLIYKGDILKGFHLNKNISSLPILTVLPKLTTKSLIAHTLLSKQELRNATSDFNMTKFRALNVEIINNVTWNEFYENVFLKNRDNEINGNLSLLGRAKILNMTDSNELNGLQVENFFNLERPQVVHSNILFSGFLVKDLHAETINGLDFANDIVFQHTDDLIETPVNMYRLSITNDMLLDENVAIVRKSNEELNGFQQHYTGRVLINGSLTVKNLNTEANGRKIILKEKYFLKNEAQNLNSTVVFGNAKVTVPSLSSKYLNDNPVDEHLLADESSKFKKPLVLIIMNARIEGDLSSEHIKTRIANLSRNAVRRGDVANITGVKTFNAPVTIEHVMTLSMNELPVIDLVLKSQLNGGGSFQLKGMKAFNAIFVDGEAIVDRTLNVTNLNKLPLDDLLNYDYHIEKLKVPFQLEAKNIVFDKINGIDFDGVFSNFKLRDGQLVLHKELIIDGNVSFGEDLNVTNINDINWNEYHEDLVRTNDNAIIEGKKCFLAELTITDRLRTPSLNDVKMEQIFDKILSKSRPQFIEGAYTFEKLKLTNLDVPIVNNMPITEFIDVRMPTMTIQSDLIVPEVIILGDVITGKKNELLQLDSYVEQIRLLPNRYWRNIVVTEHAFWHDGNGNAGKAQSKRLGYLKRFAVQRYGQQVITGNVKLTRPLIKNMKTTTTFPEDIDFDYLVKDCLLKRSIEPQIIAARKTFLMRVYTSDVVAKSYVAAHLVNGIDVLQLNSSLYYLSSNYPIIGPIKFRIPPKFESLIVNGRINDIDPSVIYHNTTELVPPITICKLTVRNTVDIGDINSKNLNRLLEKRIKKQNSESNDIIGSINFEHLILNQKAVVQSINGLPVEKCVFKQSQQLQAISGAKTIEGDLILDGPAHVLNLNGDDLIENYQQSLFVNRNYHHDKLIIDEATFEKGVIFTESTYPLLASTMEDTKTTEISRKSKVIENELHEIDRILSEKAKTTKNLLYIDYANDWKIFWHSPPDDIEVQKRFTFEDKNSSLCEHRYNIVDVIPMSPESDAGVIYLSNYTTNTITTSSYDIKVKAENLCHHKYRRLKSKITITDTNRTRVIGMKKYIENVVIFSPDNNHTIFLLIHAIDLSRNQHEIRVLKVLKGVTAELEVEEKNITDWQSLTLGVGKTLRLYQYTNYTVLISGGGGLLTNHPVLVIYHLNMETQKFELAQTIDGDFDIHELIPTHLKDRFQLILSCRQSHRVHIYSHNPSRVERPYEIMQILKLKTLVDRIQPFKVSDGSTYLLVLAENGHHYYYLYRLSSLQGWLHLTSGYYENTKLVFPLIGVELQLDDANLLALLCGVNSCNVVRAVVV